MSFTHTIGIREWIGRAWPHELPKVCYISVQLIDDHYDLEVEISHGTIGGIYGTEQSDLDVAQSLADELDAELTKRGVKVVYTRDEWEDMELDE